MSENTERLTIIGWSINVEWSNGKKENILDIDDQTAQVVDDFLSDYEFEVNSELDDGIHLVVKFDSDDDREPDYDAKTAQEIASEQDEIYRTLK